MFTVPGKRKRPTAGLPTENHGPTRKRGRPFKRSPALRPPRTLLLAQQKAYSQLSKTGSRLDDTRISSLESLPNELIQQIFFLSLAINLAKASRRLATALSTESTFRVLILFAYFDEDETCPVDAKLFLPARYRTLTLKEKLDLQARILTCRWCTVDRIMSCLPALSRLAITQEWYREHEEEARLRKDYGAKFSVIVNQPDLRSQARLPDLDNYLELEAHFFARARQPVPNGAPEPEATSGIYLPRILTWAYQSEAAESGLTIKSLSCSRSILPARLISNALLRSASSMRENIRMIQVLRNGFEHIKQDPIMMISASALLEAINTAISHQNHEVVMILLELHATFIQERPRNGLNSMWRGSPSGPPLPLRSFHLAAKQDDQSSKLMWLLVRYDVRAIPHNDGVLTAWAVRHKTAHKQIAKRLLDFMAGVDDPDWLQEQPVDDRNIDIFGGTESQPADLMTMSEIENLGRETLPTVEVHCIPSPDG